MAGPRIVPKSEKKGKPKIVDADMDDWDIDKSMEGMKVNSIFSPRRKGPGDLIMADDWNTIQIEIKDDITNIITAIDSLASKSSFLIASGVSSHGMYVELNWGLKPHVLLSYSGPLVENTEENKHVRCYPYDLSEKGFRIYAKSDDGRLRGIVNWIAFGVVQ